jgi:hypothetical protein
MLLEKGLGDLIRTAMKVQTLVSTMFSHVCTKYNFGTLYPSMESQLDHFRTLD